VTGRGGGPEGGADDLWSQHSSGPVNCGAMARTPKELPAPEAILERENKQRKPAAFAALAAFAFAIIATVLEFTIAGQLPDKNVATDLVEAISAQLSNVPAPTSYATKFAMFKLEHQTTSILIALLHGAGTLLFAPMIILLLRGARERGGSLARWLEPLAFAGVGLLGISTIASGILEMQAFKSLSPAELLQAGSIKDVLQTQDLLIAGTISSLAGLFVGVPLALGAMQAFRVGMVPRFMGLLGVLIGIFIVFRNLPNGPFVIGIWFAYTAMIVLGKAPDGLPETWRTGKAVEPPARQPRAPKAPSAPPAPKREKPSKAEKPAKDTPSKGITAPTTGRGSKHK
jgi:hypothetical protein